MSQIPDFSHSIIEQDLDAILHRTAALWPQFVKARIFITGGSGFIGCWLLEVLREADRQFQLGLQVLILSRDPQSFAHKAPHLANYSGFAVLQGDVTDFISPLGEFSHIIHAATDASAALNEHNPLKMFDTIVAGTRRVLALAAEKKTAKVLFLSSGAVYGQQPWEMQHIPETVMLGPDSTDPRNTYAQAKRSAEMLCAIYQKQFGVPTTIARIFSLLGPGLALGIHFAAGNFIRNAIDGKPVIVNGNGLPCRSYLYTTDLVVWLLYLLQQGRAGQAYNVGSEHAISIAELAARVAKVIGQGEYQILGAPDTGWNPGRYVPDIQRIKTDLGMQETLTLDQAILRTALWNGWKGTP
jgi:nucleoside-diphosphate-sugar epimerase